MKPTAFDVTGDSHLASLEGGIVEFRPNKSISGTKYVSGIGVMSRGGEIESFNTSNITENPPVTNTPFDAFLHSSDSYRNTANNINTYYGDTYIIDGATLSFNSPEIEFDENL